MSEHINRIIDSSINQSIHPSIHPSINQSNGHMSKLSKKQSIIQSNKRFQRPTEERKEFLVTQTIICDQSSDDDADTEQSYGEEDDDSVISSINQSIDPSINQTRPRTGSFPLKRASGTESTESGDDDEFIQNEIESINQTSNQSSPRLNPSQAIIIPRSSVPPSLSIDQTNNQTIGQPLRSNQPINQTVNRNVPHYMQNGSYSQSVNQPTQSPNQSTPSSPVYGRYGLPPPPQLHGQAVSQTNNQTNNQSNNRPYSPRPPVHPMSLPLYQAINQPMSPSSYQPNHQTNGQSVNQSVNRQLPIPPTVNRPPSRSFDHSFTRPSNQSVSPSNNRSNTPSHHYAQVQPISSPYQFATQTNNQSSHLSIINQTDHQRSRRISDASSDSSHNHSINSPVSQSTDPSNSQPINQLADHTIDEPTNQGIDQDLFTLRGWHNVSADILLATTQSIDECCRSIVSINQSISQSSSMSLETRRLALTVAVFERSLYAYALRIQSNKSTKQPDQQNGLSSNHSTPSSHPRSISQTSQSSNQSHQQSNHSSPPFAPRETDMNQIYDNSSSDSLAALRPHSHLINQPHNQSTSGLLHRVGSVRVMNQALNQLNSQSIPPTVTAPSSTRSTDAGNFFAPQPINQSVNQSIIQSMTPTHRSMTPTHQSMTPIQQPMNMSNMQSNNPVMNQLTPRSIYQMDPRSASPIDSLAHSPRVLSNTPSPIDQSFNPSNSQTIHQTIVQTTKPAWHQPAGMSCLLKILTNLLNNIQSTLDHANNQSTTFLRFLHYLVDQSISLPIEAFKHVVDQPKPAMIVVSSIAVLSMILSTKPARITGRFIDRLIKLFLFNALIVGQMIDQSDHTKFLLSFVPTWCRDFINKTMNRSNFESTYHSIKQALHTRAAFTIIPVMLYITYRIQLHYRVTKLRKLHSRLGLLLRLWHICFSLIEQPNSQDDQSNNQFIDQSDEQLLKNSATPRVPISRWLLQLVPPELDSSFWYGLSFNQSLNQAIKLSIIKYGMDVLYCTTSLTMKIFGRRSINQSTNQSVSQVFGPYHIGMPFFFLCGIYHTMNPSVSSSKTSRMMSSPNIAVVKAAWLILESMNQSINRLIRKFGWSRGFVVCQLIELVADDSVSSKDDSAFEYEFISDNQTINQWIKPANQSKECIGRPLSPSQQSIKQSKIPRVINISSTKAKRKNHVSTRLREMKAIDESADQSTDPAVNVLLLSNRSMNITINLRYQSINQSMSQSSSQTSKQANASKPSTPVIIYYHGGGWITDFQTSHLNFLSQWTDALDVPILYVNYQQINFPKHPHNQNSQYPSTLHECYDVYRWLIEGRLGLNATSVLLVGDSTGANLAAAVCNQAIIDSIRVPDGMLLACPILNLRSTPTPSRSLYMTDPVLPMNLLLQLRTLYLNNQTSNHTNNQANNQSLNHYATLVDTDPCLSPIVAPDQILSQWPTTGIMVGSFDPFVDDSVDFAHRLTQNGVKVKLRIFDQAPHSLWDFAPILDVSQEAVDLVPTWAKQILDDVEQKKRVEEID